MLDEDMWGSDSEGEHGRHLSSELDHEWQAQQNQFHTLGYRDGVEAGKSSSVQEGFNVGCAEATVAGSNWGGARGLTSAFAALPALLKEKLVGEGEARGRLETLESSILAYSSADAVRSFYHDLASQACQNSWCGRSELEELEKKVRDEFGVASIEICDVLVGV